jgi:hypothetical protein
LRRRFQTASSTQDYRALGTNCVGVLEALGQVVYDPTKHLREGETIPPRDKTKHRIGRYIENALAGPANEFVRGLTHKAVELAHHVKHSPTGTRRDAGIAADAVIMMSTCCAGSIRKSEPRGYSPPAETGPSAERSRSPRTRRPPAARGLSPPSAATTRL